MPKLSQQQQYLSMTKPTQRNQKLLENSPSREKYKPLTHLDKIKLANHIDQLTETFVETVPIQIVNWQKMLPSQIEQQNRDSLLTVEEKQRVVA